jgi:hypothetical protein
MSHTVPAPFGAAAVVVPLGPELPVRAYCAGIPKRYPGRLWKAKLVWMP